MMNFDDLKTIHRDNRVNFKEEFSTRIHRSLSWIKRAEMESEDSDASFIFLWIAFNAAYKFVGGAAGITPTSTSGAIDRIDYIVQNAAAGYVCLTCNFTANYVA